MIGITREGKCQVVSEGDPSPTGREADQRVPLTAAGRLELLDSLTTLLEASLLAYLACNDHRSWGTDEDRDRMAGRLCELLELYAVSQDTLDIRKLSAAERREGAFRGGGRELAFSDGRPAIGGLAVQREALEKAIEQLTGKPRR